MFDSESGHDFSFLFKLNFCSLSNWLFIRFLYHTKYKNSLGRFVRPF